MRRVILLLLCIALIFSFTTGCNTEKFEFVSDISYSSMHDKDMPEHVNKIISVVENISLSDELFKDGTTLGDVMYYENAGKRFDYEQYENALNGEESHLGFIAVSSDSENKNYYVAITRYIYDEYIIRYGDTYDTLSLSCSVSPDLKHIDFIRYDYGGEGVKNIVETQICEELSQEEIKSMFQNSISAKLLAPDLTKIEINPVSKLEIEKYMSFYDSNMEEIRFTGIIDMMNEKFYEYRVIDAPYFHIYVSQNEPVRIYSGEKNAGAILEWQDGNPIQ